jgi:hypothetical protein
MKKTPATSSSSPYDPSHFRPISPWWHRDALRPEDVVDLLKRTAHHDNQTQNSYSTLSGDNGTPNYQWGYGKLRGYVKPTHALRILHLYFTSAVFRCQMRGSLEELREADAVVLKLMPDSV